MNWEKVGKISFQFALSAIEWGFKICAFVAGTLALSAPKQSFGSKVGIGFGSLSQGLREFFSIPATFKEISWTVREYHQMGAADFQEAYGMAPMDQLFGSLNSLFSLTNQISVNLYLTPFASIFATLLVFASFYVLGRVIRFARQRGRGSYLCRQEQRLGDWVFNRGDSETKEKAPKTSNRRVTNKGFGRSSPKLT